MLLPKFVMFLFILTVGIDLFSNDYSKRIAYAKSVNYALIELDNDINDDVFLLRIEDQTNSIEDDDASKESNLKMNQNKKDNEQIELMNKKKYEAVSLVDRIISTYVRSNGTVNHGNVISKSGNVRNNLNSSNDENSRILTIDVNNVVKAINTTGDEMYGTEIIRENNVDNRTNSECNADEGEITGTIIEGNVFSRVNTNGTMSVGSINIERNNTYEGSKPGNNICGVLSIIKDNNIEVANATASISWVSKTDRRNNRY